MAVAVRREGSMRARGTGAEVEWQSWVLLVMVEVVEEVEGEEDDDEWKKNPAP
jgi:hypothetical protein